MVADLTTMFVVQNDTLTRVTPSGTFDILGPAGDWPGVNLFAAVP